MHFCKTERFSMLIHTLVSICISYVSYATALKCLTCDNVPSARDCFYLAECGPHAICHAAQVVSQAGHIYRNFGCKDKRTCAAKRSMNARDFSDDVIRAIPDSDVIVCDECCATPFCQAGLCHDNNYETDRGTFCYGCDKQPNEVECDKYIECGRDEGCYESLSPSPQQTYLVETGCMQTAICDNLLSNTNISASVNNHADGQHCFTCCNKDLCNQSCHPPTVAPIASGHNCTDPTDEYTCKLASTIVCGDRSLAANAGCQHFCGFC